MFIVLCTKAFRRIKDTRQKEWGKTLQLSISLVKKSGPWKQRENGNAPGIQTGVTTPNMHLALCSCQPGLHFSARCSSIINTWIVCHVTRALGDQVRQTIAGRSAPQLKLRYVLIRGDVQGLPLLLQAMIQAYSHRILSYTEIKIVIVVVLFLIV